MICCMKLGIVFFYIKPEFEIIYLRSLLCVEYNVFLLYFRKSSQCMSIKMEQ